MNSEINSSQEQTTALLNEIFIAPSKQTISERFNSEVDDATGCGTRCGKGCGTGCGGAF